MLEASRVMKNELAVGPPELRAQAFYVQRHMVAKFAGVPGCAEKVEELREARVAQRRLALRPPPLLDAREAVQRGDHVHRVHRLGVARARQR